MPIRFLKLFLLSPRAWKKLLHIFLRFVEYKEVLEFCGAAEKTRLANTARPKDEVVSTRKVNSELADIFSNYENESEETKELMRRLAAVQGKDLEALVAARNGK